MGLGQLYGGQSIGSLSGLRYGDYNIITENHWFPVSELGRVLHLDRYPCQFLYHVLSYLGRMP